MNTIHYGAKEELNGRFLMKFSCSDISGIRTDLRPHERTDTENKLLGTVSDRITLALQERGYEVVSISFWSMLISAVKSEVENV